jgi:hypothetical protein
VSIHVTRQYTPDLARQVKAILRLLESCDDESMKGQHGTDVSQEGESFTKPGGNQNAQT